MKTPLPLYRPFGDPDTGLITVNDSQTVGDKVTIGGVDFVLGTDFSSGGLPEQTAELLAAAINGGTAYYGRQSSSIVRPFWAYFIGRFVKVVATQPGSSGITLTETGTSFTVSGATLSGGTGVSPSSGGASSVGSGNAPVSRVTSTGTAATLFIARPTRTGVLVRNTDAANSVWIGPATVTTSNGFLLKAGESLPIPFTGLYQVIDDGSNHAVIHVLDCYN